MKVCAVCGASAAVSASSCGACGEGSWKPFVASSPKAAPVAAPVAEPKKAKKTKKASSSVEPVAAPEESVAASGEISDEDFAAEIAAASDVDLLALMGETSAMPESWRAMLTAEIEKRGAQ